MSPRAIWTLLSTFGPMAVIAALGVAVVALKVSRDHHAGENRAHQACIAAVDEAERFRSGVDLAAVCPKSVAAAVAGHTAARSCEASAAQAHTAGIPLTCPEPVRAIAADREGRAKQVGDLEGALQRLRADQASAINRAVARAESNAQRKAHADAVLAAAPRTAAGRIVLDAGSLCELAGCTPAGR